LLEHSQSQIRAKALLTIYIIMQLNPSSFLACCEAKILPVLERISKDKETYVRHCMKAAIHGIMNLVPVITSKITSEIKLVLDKKKNLNSSPKSLRDKLQQFPIILHLMTSPFLRYKIFTPELIADLSYYLTTVEELKFLSYDDFKGTLLLVLEAISQNPALLVPQHEHVIQHLLPSLISLLKSESGDTRFLCLKIFIDVLTEFMSQPGLYSVCYLLLYFVLMLFYRLALNH
jgi:serine/threonine-protein kinase ULK4